MADLDPIKRALDREPDEQRVQRMWREIESRRATTTPVRARAVWIAAPVLAIAAAILFAVLSRRAPGPLVLESGSGLPAVIAERTALSDGSTVSLEANARVEVLENSATNMGFALRSGRARFDIVPGGPRTWRVECGDVTVEVVGTAFTVARDGEHVSVDVHRGAVLVRGDRVPDRVQRLHAGDAIDVAPRAAPEPPPTIEPPIEPVVVPPVVAPPVRRPAWREAAARGDYDGAFDSLGEGGIDQASARAAGVDELMALADVARLSGHPRDAVTPLSRLIDEHGSDRRAAVAAYTLGTLYLERLGDPAQAASAFERAIELGVPRALREPALANRAIALGRADGAGLEQAIDAYLREYPEGSYRPALERLRP